MHPSDAFKTVLEPTKSPHTGHTGSIKPVHPSISHLPNESRSNLTADDDLYHQTTASLQQTVYQLLPTSPEADKLNESEDYILNKG